ncbi:hypothetical protein VNO80_08555 [Phaseolus coccineus]|uniref:Uncharacterized protein n=1 Tax=Phaseolus coccineus TaxID=3886 RepID=A0AAN9N9U0_PHACN
MLCAIRGTIAKARSVSCDIELDIHVGRNRLHQTSRSEIAIHAVRNMVATVGGSNICIVTAGLTIAMKAKQKSLPFAALSSWVPCLFVNPSDPICCESISDT